MKVFDLSRFDCFQNKDRAALLNDFLEINQSIMPHGIAAATGCRLEEALALLLVMYSEQFVEGYVLMYHSPHLETPFGRRRLYEGLPPPNHITCSICEMADIPDRELYFDLEFVLTEPIEFVSKQ